MRWHCGRTHSRMYFPHPLIYNERKNAMLPRLFKSVNLLLLTSSVVAFTGTSSHKWITTHSLPSLTSSRSFSSPLASKINDHDAEPHVQTPTPTLSHRRSFLQTATALVLASPLPSSAGIDPSALKSLPVEGDATGATSRLRQLSSLSDSGPRPEDSKDIAFEVLPSGASYREYREGKGDAAVRPGSKVAVEMTVRCRSFATANEPGGLKYFSTKDDTEFNELAWTVGEYDGEGSNPVPPELEEAMMGMKKGAVRRIELPSTVVFKARKLGRLPVPAEKNKEGTRLFEKLFKTDATLLFEVLVTRIK